MNDIRMKGFARRSKVEDATAWVDSVAHCLPSEKVPLAEGAGRVLAGEIVSRVDVPGFDRAMMDGLALRAADTAGATNYLRLATKVIGESFPARPFEGKITPGTAIRIMTGSPLPAGADAVLPVEQVQFEEEAVYLCGEVPPGKHVGRQGEDIAIGAAALPAGRRLRPQDVGLLSSIGVAEVPVVRRPRVRILPTGNELLPPGSLPSEFHIVDSNSPMLRALVERDGGQVSCSDIVPDDPDKILAAMRDDVDVVLVSGGSSVGEEDHAPQLIANHGTLAIHGIAMRPSSPAGMGTLDEKLVFLLPGNPASCLCAYDFFAGRAIRQLAGRSGEWPYRRIEAPLSRKLVSVVGRLDYARVAIAGGQAKPIAISGASILTSTVHADGFVILPADSEGYEKGATVEVFLYDT